MAIGEHKDVLIKIYVILSAFMVFLTGLLHIFGGNAYTSTLTCFYLIFFTVVIVLLEISPYIYENYIVVVFPFL
jgi:hypothetical protein